MTLRGLFKKRKELSNYGLQSTESFGGAVKFYEEKDLKQTLKDVMDDLRINAYKRKAPVDGKIYLALRLDTTEEILEEHFGKGLL